MSIRDDSIRIAVGDGHIDGTIIAPATRMPGVLFVHGWGGCQEQYVVRAREIAELGCVCLAFDLRGHARTRAEYETVSREKNLEDVVAAYDVLVSHHGVDPSAIAVVGSSYGGYLGAILTTKRPVKWLTLRVPALYMDEDWQLPKRQLHQGQALITYRQSPVAAADNRALRACAAFQGDVLLVESEFDTIIPHAVVCSYREAFVQTRSLSYRLMEGADHGLTEDKAQLAYTRLLVNWFTDVVCGVRGPKTPAPPPSLEPGALPETPPRAA